MEDEPLLDEGEPLDDEPPAAGMVLDEVPVEGVLLDEDGVLDDELDGDAPLVAGDVLVEPAGDEPLDEGEELDELPDEEPLVGAGVEDWPAPVELLPDELPLMPEPVLGVLVPWLDDVELPDWLPAAWSESPQPPSAARAATVKPKVMVRRVMGMSF